MTSYQWLIYRGCILHGFGGAIRPLIGQKSEVASSFWIFLRQSRDKIPTESVAQRHKLRQVRTHPLSAKYIIFLVCDFSECRHRRMRIYA